MRRFAKIYAGFNQPATIAFLRGTKMTGKEFLNKVLESRRELDGKLEKFKHLQAMATRITGAISGTPTVSDKSFSRIESAVTNALKQSEDVTDEVTNFFNQYLKAEKLIAKVPAIDERLVLNYRYLCGDSWREIAKTMQVSLRHLYRVHGNALETFEKIFVNGDKCAQMSPNVTLKTVI